MRTRGQNLSSMGKLPARIQPGYHCIQFVLPRRSLISNPFQQKGQSVRSDLPNGLKLSLCQIRWNRRDVDRESFSPVNFRICTQGGFESLHPLTQPLPLITRLPRRPEHQRPQTNQHRNHNQHQKKSSLSHSITIMPSRVREASQKALHKTIKRTKQLDKALFSLLSSFPSVKFFWSLWSAIFLSPNISV